MFGKRNVKPAARCFTQFVITAGIVIYPIAEVLQSRSETKKENRSIIQSISVLSVQHLLYPNGKTSGFAVMPAGKKRIETTVRRIDISKTNGMSTSKNTIREAVSHTLTSRDFVCQVPM